MKLTKPVIHSTFRLNQKQFKNKEMLLDYLLGIDQNAYEFISDWFDDTYKIQLKTSGSTGKPKTISMLKEQMLASAKATVKTLDLPPKTTALLCLSSSYIAGKMMWVRALTYGWHLDLIAPSNKIEIPNNSTYDFTALVPMQLVANQYNLHQFKKIIVGGGATNLQFIASLPALPTKIWATYGMTETVSHVALRALYPNLENGYSAIEGVSFEKDSRGCLCIRAPHLNSRTLVTNDLIDLIGKNTFIWKGRLDFVINSGGIKFSPELIEEKLQKFIDKRILIAGVPDEVLGEKMVLLIETPKEFCFTSFEQSKTYDQKETFIADLKEMKVLEAYEVPKEVYLVPSFIETETKKIQRKKTLDLIY